MSSIESLHTTVRELTRARQRQLMLEWVFAGLFFGLAGACLAVFVARLNDLAVAPPLVASVCVAGAVLVALLAVRRTYPDDLQVAIRVDITLRLKERLSSAIEFARSGHDPMLVERLAAQALKARLPGRVGQLFPLRLNVWARLTPILAVLLVLVSILEFQTDVAALAAPSDRLLSAEGARLQAYARDLGTRARREGLSRSEAQSKRMQSLGERMRSSAFSRREALGRLRDFSASLQQQAREALAQEGDSRRTLAGLNSLSPAAQAAEAALREALSRMANGRMVPESIGGLVGDAGTLAELGIDPEALRQALENFEAGDSSALEKLLRSLPRMQLRSADADALREAREEIDAARARLGDRVSPQDRDSVPNQAVPGRGRYAESSRGGEFPDDGEWNEEQSGWLPAAGKVPSRTDQDAQTTNEIPHARGAVLIKPDSQLLSGDVLTTQARALPRAGTVKTELVEIAPRFAPQIEEVMSKEDYPLHYKEFIRRYFMKLSAPEHGGGTSEDVNR